MKKMKKARIEKGLTQVELSFHAQVPISEISRIECGRVSDPYGGYAERLARVLGLEPEELNQEAEPEEVAAKV